MPNGSPDLSEREMEVLRLLARGHTEHAIAERLIVSSATVHTHVIHIYQKLDVHASNDNQPSCWSLTVNRAVPTGC